MIRASWVSQCLVSKMKCFSTRTPHLFAGYLWASHRNTVQNRFFIFFAILKHLDKVETWWIHLLMAHSFHCLKHCTSKGYCSKITYSLGTTIVDQSCYPIVVSHLFPQQVKILSSINRSVICSKCSWQTIIFFFAFLQIKLFYTVSWRWV